jgi:branched-chain amino acid transport system substrate-binding protein
MIARRLRIVGCLMTTVILVALSAAGCGSSNSAGTGLVPGAPLEIGYLASLTGYCREYARDYVQGAQLAVRQINARGGVLGHRLELIVRDDRANADTGISRARELVVNDHVKYLAGTCSSEVAKHVAQLVANPNHVLYAVGAADPSIFEGGPMIFVFGTIPTAEIEARNAAAYMRAHPQWKRVGVITDDYSYGYQVTTAFRRAMRGSGRTVLPAVFVPSGAADFTPYIERLLAQHPQAVYSTVITADAVTLVAQGQPLGLFEKDHFFGVMDYGTMAAMPNPPLGIEGYTNYPSAAIYQTPLARALGSLGTAAANSGAAGDAFNQIELIAQGIEKADSTDPAKVRDALAGARVQAVQGPVRVQCNHVLAVPIAMGTVAGPSTAQPFAHFEPLTLVPTSRYFDCREP